MSTFRFQPLGLRLWVVVGLRNRGRRSRAQWLSAARLPGTPWCPPACLQTLYCFSRLTSSGCSVLRQGGRHFGEGGRAAESRQEEGTPMPGALSPVPLLRRAWGSNTPISAGSGRKRAELLRTTEEVQWAKGRPRRRAGGLRTELQLRRL